MPYIYKDTVNIYDDEAIARAIRTQETQFQVLQGKISSLITDSELEVLRNGGSTMYSRMSSTEQTVEGISTQVSSIQTDLRDNRPTVTSMNSAITQKANEITTSVNQTLQNYSTTSQMNTAIQQSANSITQTASQTYATKNALNTLEGRVGTAESKITPTAIINTVTSSDGVSAMVSSINQSANTVKIQAAHINLVGAVTANDLATGSVTADKIGAGAITTDKLAANAVTSAKIAANTITGDNIQAGSISAACLDVNSIFAQDITATGTITGAHLIGANCEIDEGYIGNWSIIDGDLTCNGAIINATAINSFHSCVHDVNYNMFGSEYGYGTDSGLLQRVSNLETSPVIPSDISCATVTATGGISGNSLTATLGVSGGSLSITGSASTGALSVTGSIEATQNITADHTLYCNTLQVTGSAHVAGNVWASYNTGSGTTAIWSGGELRGQSSSSRRYKDHVSSVTLEEALRVLDIPVINFRYKDGYLADGDEMEGKAIPGFYAEDIEGLVPIAVYHNKDGQVENWQERVILPLMLKVIQEQQHEIDELKRR